MTEFEHVIVGAVILILLWFLFLKRYFISGKAVRAWEDMIQRFFRK